MLNGALLEGVWVKCSSQGHDVGGAATTAALHMADVFE
jgi:hypothetical protein